MKRKVYLIFIVFIIFFAIVEVFLSSRIIWYFGIESKILINIIVSVFVITVMIGTVTLRNTTGKFYSVFYKITATALGIMIYLISSTIFVELFHLFLKFEPIYFGLIVVFLTIILSIFGIFNAKFTRFTSFSVLIKGIDAETKIAHLSDVHLGHFRGEKFLRKIVYKVNEKNPDFIVITGDLIDGKSGLKPENIKPLSEFKSPVFFVEGNHDNYANINILKQLLRQNNVTVLENEIRNCKNTQIVGLNHLPADEFSTNFHTKHKKLSIKSVISEMNIDKQKPAILLHHSPDGVKYADLAKIDLFLSGHTHAGQLFPINLITKIMFKYNKGLNIYNDTKIFVSQGVGTTNPPMRVGTKSEIALITLKPN
ncbi:MAG: metallophosphoesterase [Bacteroidales bacterium]|nr:metallophosphoesterase [Bacteroidales bacterium]